MIEKQHTSRCRQTLIFLALKIEKVFGIEGFICNARFAYEIFHLFVSTVLI